VADGTGTVTRKGGGKIFFERAGGLLDRGLEGFGALDFDLGEAGIGGLRLFGCGARLFPQFGKFLLQGGVAPLAPADGEGGKEQERL